MATKKPKPTATGTEAVKPRPTPPPAFPVVGIGASAGGLAAIEEFLAAMPADEPLSMAFVLVQHLDPDHKSILLELVKRYTSMEVEWAKNGMVVRPGCAYVMPPNKDMALAGGRLVLTEPEAPRGLRLPIDSFFRSLAADQHERAVCIVLSGTGSDGTLGVRAVKGEGGMAIAQSPESAAYDGMPQSAISTGMVDFVLAPKDMPEQLIGYVDRAFKSLPSAAHPGVAAGPDYLLEVLHLLRDRTGHDFTHYKTSTLRRRVERRMAVTKLESMIDYVALVRHDTLEAETLFRELLIGVTNFFRDTPAFEALETEVLGKLVAAHVPGDPVRVWVPGCSTGEEAYSIAMLVQEQAASLKRNIGVQVFATDIDIDAIERARAGVYPASIAADVSPERLARFFVQDGPTYRVAKSVRDCLVFAKQDVTKDPPFSRVDLISCRNLLIYMDGDLQQKLMPLFHYALNPGGYLFLGSSETVGDAADLFAPVDKKWKLFQRRESVTPRLLMPTTMPPRGTRQDIGGRFPLEPVPLRIRVRDLAERTLLEKHAPACAVINAEGDVLYIHGHTGRYLEPAPGEPTGSIYKMAREGLRLEISTGVRKVLTQNEPVRYERLRVKSGDDIIRVNLVIEPMAGPDAVKGVMLVIFEDVATVGEDGDPAVLEPLADREQRIADLDRELSAKEEYLRTAVEELETSNEELKSTNEEMQSTNEELQSTNEELETSREELQSVNEELVTVNSELQQKIEELSHANNDMNNMLAGTGIGTLFVDQNQLIQRFTPRVTEIMNLIPTDVGRPLGDIAPRVVGDVDLVGAVTTVLDTLATVEAQVSSDKRVFQMRAQPYRTVDNVIEGAVLTFVDVTEQRAIEAAKRESDTRFRTIFDQAPLGVALIDSLDGRICEVNPQFAKIAGRTVEQMTSLDWMSITHPDDVPDDLANMARLNAGEIPGFSMNKRYMRPDGSVVWINMTVAAVEVSDPTHPRHLCMIEDITQRRQLEAGLADAAAAVAETGEFAQSVLDTIREPQLVLDGELRVVTANKAFLSAFETTSRGVVGRPLAQIDDGAWDNPELIELLLKVLPKKKKLGDYRLTLSGGALAPAAITIHALELLQTPEKRRLMLLTVTDIGGAN